MIDSNVYLNVCSSSVNCTLMCGTLEYLVLTAQPVIFSTFCGTAFIQPVNSSVHPHIPTPVPSAAALTILVRDHKNNVRVFNEYHAVEKACKKVIQKLIPENFTSLSQAASSVSTRSHISPSLLISPLMGVFMFLSIYWIASSSSSA